MNAKITGLGLSAVFHAALFAFVATSLFGDKTSSVPMPTGPLAMTVSAFQESTPEPEPPVLTPAPAPIAEPVQEPEPEIEPKPVIKPKSTLVKKKITQVKRKKKKKVILKPRIAQTHPQLPPTLSKLQTQTEVASTRTVKSVPVPAVAQSSLKPGLITMIWKNYKEGLHKVIEQNRRYPLQSRRRHEQGTVILKFRVDKDGRISNISVSRSSGHQRLDDAAMAIVQSIRRFQPFPSSIREAHRVFELPIKFVL